MLLILKVVFINVSALVSVGLAWVVYKSNQKSIRNISLMHLAIATAMWLVAFGQYEVPSIFDSTFWIKVVYAIVPFLVYAMLQFSIIFPKNIAPQKWIFPVYLLSNVPILGVLFFTKEFVRGTIRTEFGAETHLGSYYPFIMVYWSFFLFLAIYNLLKKYALYRGYVKVQIGYMLAGISLFGSISFVVAVVAPVVFGTSRYFSGISIGGFLFLWITIFAIVKHRLMDIKLIVARSISFTVLLILFGFSYASSLFLIENVLFEGLSSRDSFLVSTLLSVFMAFTFQPLRMFLEKITNNVFFKESYDPQELLHRFSQTIATTPFFSDLTFKLLDVISSEMQVSKAFFSILRKDNIYIAGSKHQENELSLSKAEIECIRSENNAIMFDEVPEGKLRELMQRNEISIIYPLRTNDSFIGGLLVGEKSSGDMFFEQDLNIFDIICPELAVAFQNSERYEEIAQFNATLIEKIKVATENLRDANNKLKKLDTLKDEFISIASHDLRAPLGNIKGNVWLAIKDVDSNSSSAALNHLEKALESTERSISLVNDMLDVSRIEAGRIELNLAPVDLKILASEVLSEAEKTASEKRIKLTISSSGSLITMADSDRVHQVLGNLITNAIKFTADGGKVEVKLSGRDKFVEISVSDNGMGVKKSDYGKLFKKFGRLRNGISTTPVITGTGLGLYICKKLVELFGGKIWIESEYGKSSTFTFTVPRA